MGITTAELIKLLGKSKPTIYKLVKIYNWQQFSLNMHQGGKRLIYDISIEDLKKIALQYGVPEKRITDFYLKKGTDGNLKNIEKTKTDGNQTTSMVTDGNLNNQTDGNLNIELKNGSRSLKDLSESRYAQNKLGSLLNEIPALSDRNPSIELNEKDLKIAKLRAQLCKNIDILLRNTGSKRDIWRLITDSYNEGFLIPELLSLNGIKCERTLRRWFRKYQENDRDLYELAPQYKTSIYRGRDITIEEQGFLLKILLTPNRVKPGTAIRKLKQFKRLNIVQSSSSESTIYRWIIDWKNSHLDQWTLAREGMKAFQEKVNKTIFRDSSVLSVGDVWVADGHVLNFDILDPVTGKPKRMMMIMFLDWASRYPVGASIANTENASHISAALRNAILNWGATPKHIYIDNGKAFRAKLFHSNTKEFDLEKELGGIYPRLGIDVTFATAYNAKAKVIERFFLTFQENFESLIDSFRGADIADKPANLMRNEKWVKKMYKKEPLTMEHAINLIDLYIKKMYGLTPHRGISGQKPYEVFQNAPVPNDRIIEPSRLNYLMLTRQFKKITNNGIRFNSITYWDEHLIKYVGQEVIIKYDFSDLRYILVYNKRNMFICQAKVRYHQHPMIHISDNKKLHGDRLKKEISQIKRIEKQAKQSTEETLRQIEERTSHIRLPYDNISELFENAPIIKPLKKEKTIDDIIKEQPIINIKSEKEDKENDEIEVVFDKKAIGLD